MLNQTSKTALRLRGKQQTNFLRKHGLKLLYTPTAVLAQSLDLIAGRPYDSPNKLKQQQRESAQNDKVLVLKYKLATLHAWRRPPGAEDPWYVGIGD